MSSSKEVKPKAKRQVKLTKLIEKIDGEKKQPKQWAHYERLIYARLLLAFSMNQLPVNNQFCQMIAMKIKRSAHNVYCYHMRELLKWGNVHQIIIQILGKKSRRISNSSSIRNIQKIRQESITVTSDKEQIHLDEYCSLQKLQSQEMNYLNRLMIERSPDCQEYDYLNDVVQLHDMNLDEQNYDEDISYDQCQLHNFTF